MKLGSGERIADDGQGAFIHRSWIKNQDSPGVFHAQPVIGICNIWSVLTACAAYLLDSANRRRNFAPPGSARPGGVPEVEVARDHV